MKIHIDNNDYFPAGEYSLTDLGKLGRAMHTIAPNMEPRALLIEYDKIGGQIIDTTRNRALPAQTFWNIEQQKLKESVTNLSDEELLTIIRRAENTNVPGSRYQRASTEMQIRQGQKLIDATRNNSSSFIKIASGAQIKDLTVTGNTTIGVSDFIRNEGELQNATLEHNQQIMAGDKISKQSWWKKPEIIIALVLLTVAVISIPWWPNLLGLFGLIDDSGAKALDIANSKGIKFEDSIIQGGTDIQQSQNVEFQKTKISN